MRNGRKAALSLLTLSVLLMAACGGNDGSNAAASPNASPDASTASAGASAPAETNKTPVKLTFATYNAWWNMENLQKAIKMYEEETGNTIEPQIYPDDQFMNVLKAKLATGDVPDVFAFNPSVKDFGQDQLAPLNGPWVDKLDKSRAVKNGYTWAGDDKVYVAPYGSTSFMGLMYNKDVVAKAGVTLPLKTYGDLLAAAEKIKAAGAIPLYMPNKEAWTAQIDVFAGSQYIAMKNPDFAQQVASGKLKYQDEPLLVDMFKRIADFQKKGYMNADMASATMPMAEQALAEGKTAFVAGGNWLYQDFVLNYPDKAASIGMTPFTWGDDPADLSVFKGGSGNGLYIPAASKQPEAAMDFINFVMSDKVMQAMYEIAPGANDVGAPTKASPWDTELQALIDNGTAKTGDAFNDAANAIEPNFDSGDMGAAGQALFAGKDPVKALEDLYNSVAKKNKAKKIPGF
ncbi:ABC transporter substrate-binding protein [Cohnella hashimotonis]|uniref:Extracellular solute-binding protein n=1 Tax=Cohnella hashimotonis TaxID=2826895 RepID=A0ABT6TBV4_9BACL|nr:extracellular solute-binding protein [Cohnella hashimotonis]